MINTVITKPTKQCNADCSFCSAPPEVNGAGKWTLDDWRMYLEKLAPRLADNCQIIWHGGEPMLMGPQWFEDARKIANEIKPDVKFSIQTNLLAYRTETWRDVFRYIMEGRVSTSYDPDESERTLRGSPSRYNKVFLQKLDEALDDGLRPMVIGTYTEFTSPLSMKVYERSLAMGPGRSFDIRVNYRFPAGRARSMGSLIDPVTYGKSLLDLYERWMTEAPDFRITPLDQMLEKTLGINKNQCPWTNSCGGHFLGLEPNGDIFNCSDFADMDEDQYRFGNLKTNTVDECLASSAAMSIRGRRVHLVDDCLSCPHFSECKGGCARDSVLYERGLYGKFEYCASWKMVFGRIKQSILNGEADKLLAVLGHDAEWAKSQVIANQRDFNEGAEGVLKWL